MPRVLVVDDSFTIQNFMADCLNQLGFHDISRAANGKEALEVSTKKMPDIVTLDWNMPVMDGFTFLKELRKLPGGDKPIVIFCSTESSQPKIAQVLAAGANEYITKPFTIYDVREKFTLAGIEIPA